MRSRLILALASLLEFSHGQAVSPECTSDTAFFVECYMAESCAQSCSEEIGLIGQTRSCEKIPEYCEALSCCPRCVSLGADVVNCESKVISCSVRCSGTQSSDTSTETVSPTTPTSTAGSPMDVISPTPSPIPSADIMSAAPTPRNQISQASSEICFSRTLISVLLCHVVWQTLSA